MRKFNILTIFLALLNLGLKAQSSQQLPAFPQAEGFGAYAVGGRGGKVIFVDNLNDSGPGSLRAAILDPEPRIIIFRVSGTIALKSNLEVSNPYITIAGQTAPGDGICLKTFPLKIKNTNDVILRGIRVRPGIESGLDGNNIDGIDIEYSNNVIIDHCSASWAVDEILNTNKNVNDITIQWCIFSESLNNSIHEKGEHGYAATIGGYRASYHHNLFAHNKGRNPSIGGDDKSKTALLDFQNNVVYNWTSRVCDGKPQSMNFVSNYYKQGPATPAENDRIIVEIQASEKYGYTSRWFIENNFINKYPELTENNWSGAIRFSQGTSIGKNKENSLFENYYYLTRDAIQSYFEVLDHAGVIIPRRDQVDQRLVDEVENGSANFGNGIIDRVDQVGGWPELFTYNVPLDTDNDGMPDYWEVAEGLNINDSSDRFGIKEGEVYDNLEWYLNELASDKQYLLPPINLKGQLQNSRELVLSWDDISENELGFVIQKRNLDDKFITIDTVDANSTEYFETPTGPFQDLIYRVVAIGEKLNSVPSLPAVIDFFSGTKDFSQKKLFRVYPNPFDNYLKIELNSEKPQFANLLMYDSKGSFVTSFGKFQLEEGRNNLDINTMGLAPGIYILKYFGSGHIYPESIKIIKK